MECEIECEIEGEIEGAIEGDMEGEVYCHLTWRRRRPTEDFGHDAYARVRPGGASSVGLTHQAGVHTGPLDPCVGPERGAKT